jgi:hypothetical protein
VQDACAPPLHRRYHQQTQENARGVRCPTVVLVAAVLCAHTRLSNSLFELESFVRIIQGPPLEVVFSLRDHEHDFYLMPEPTDQLPRTEISASFLVLGFDCSHDEITNRIGVRPSAIWLKGDRIEGTQAVRRTTGWRFASDLPRQASVASHAQRILEQIYPRAKSLGDLNPERIRLSFAVYIYNLDRPPLWIDHEIVSKLSEMGAGIDFDLYNL